MGQRIQTLLIDDLDGSEAAGTVRLGLDGTECEIDLSAAHGDELRTALEPYIVHAQLRRHARTAARRHYRSGDAVDTAKVREWAKGQVSRSRTAAVSRPTSSSSTRRPQARSGLPRSLPGSWTGQAESLHL